MIFGYFAYINNLRYTDNIVIIADKAEDLQQILNTLTQEGHKRSLKINTEKTKVMVVTRTPN